ncbi:Ankyrin repeat-containing domain protein, partial [Metarhizium brunneum ARSEF 3297]
MAVRNGHEDIVTLLLDRAARFDFESHISAAVLVWTLQRGHQSIVDVFVRRALAQENGTWLRNPGFLTRYWQEQSVLFYFLKCGISLEPCDMLYEAAREGDDDVVNLLLYRGWDINLSIPDLGTALYGAVEGKRRKTVDLLLQRNADVNMPGGFCGSPLAAAIHGRNLDIVAKLLEHGARVDTVYKGETPLLLAVKQGDRNVVDRLLEHKADIKARTALGSCILSEAIFRNDSDMALHLLRKNVSIDQVNSVDWTPLTVAVMQRDMELVKALLLRETQANTLDGQGTTPLTMAVRGNQLAIVKCLLESGRADPTISDCRARTPLSWACREQNKAIFDLLKLVLGKNCDALDQYGRALNAAAAAPFNNDNFEELVRINKIDWITLSDLLRHDLNATM